MSRKSRLLRLLLTIVLLLLFVRYFAFYTLLFDPFESELGVDVSGLVDDRVDFFVARAQLREDFEEFPRLNAMDELEGNIAWRTWSGSPECETLAVDIGYDELMARIQQELAQLPAGVELLDVFGGKDLAVAGNFKPGGLEQADWALFGTLSNTGKLAIELLDYPGLIGLEDQGIAVEAGDDLVTLSGGNLGAALHVARIYDIGVVSNSKELVERAIELESRQFEGSFLAGSTYHDRIQIAKRNDLANEIEVFINSRALMETMQLTGAWPDPNSQDFMPSLVSKFFQLGAINHLVGILGIDEGLSLELHARLSSELMTPLQNRTYKKRAINGEDLVDKYAVFAPEDVSLFVYFKCDMGDLLHQVFNSMEPATRSLIEERFQATGKYRDLGQVIEEIDSALLDHCIFMMRENDYPEEQEGPPHNDDPMPAFAFVSFLAEGGQEKIDGLRRTIGLMGASIGLQGAEPGTSGFYSNKLGGYPFNEYWSPQISGTGVIAAGTTQEVMTITNSIPMYKHVRYTFTQGAPSHPQLAERPDFSSLALSSERGANLAIWTNPRAGLPTMKKSALRWAEDGVNIDWAFERARVEDRILREEYDGRSKDKLLPIEVGDFERAVENKIDEIDRDIRRTQIPALLEGYERKLTYLSAVRAGLIMVAADHRSLDLTMRLLVPMEF